MLKETLKSVAGPLWRYWLRHPVRFRRHMNTYFKSHCTVVRPDTSDPNLIALIENGFVILPGYHSSALIQPIHDKALAFLEQVKRGTAPAHWRTIDYREDGIYRLRDVEQLLPEASAVLEEPYLRSLVSGYLGNRPVRAKSNYIDYKPDVRHDYTSVLHMDSFESLLKIFTLLADVGERNAPMVYWARTHRDGAWRRSFDYLYWTGDPVGTHGHVPITPLREMRDRGGPDAPREEIVTGPAGTVLIADTRGIHRATCLIEGYRLEIVQKFSL